MKSKLTLALAASMLTPGARRRSAARLSSGRLLSHDRWGFGWVGQRIFFRFPFFVGAINLGFYRLSLCLGQHHHCFIGAGFQRRASQLLLLA